MTTLALLHPYLLIAFADLTYYAGRKGIPPLIITRTIDVRRPGSISDTHEEGRAIDISIRNLLPSQATELVEYCNSKSPYKDYGAIGLESGIRRLCVLHGPEIGEENHLHLQLGKDVSILN